MHALFGKINLLYHRGNIGEGNGKPAQYSLPGEFHGQRNLAGYSPWGLKESDMTEAAAAWINSEA